MLSTKPSEVNAIRIALMNAQEKGKLQVVASVIGIAKDRLIAIIAGSKPSKEEVAMILPHLQ